MGNLFKLGEKYLISSCIIFLFLARNVFAQEDIEASEKLNPTLQMLINRGVEMVEEEYARENRAADLLLQKYEAGEITLQEYYRLESERSQLEYQQEMREFEGMMDSFGSFYDPKTGPMSGLIEHASTLEAKRDRQVNALNLKIDRILADVTDQNVRVTKLKLLNVSWVPVGDATVDTEMTKFYEAKVNKIISSLD